MNGIYAYVILIDYELIMVMITQSKGICFEIYTIEVTEREVLSIFKHALFYRSVL